MRCIESTATQLFDIVIVQQLTSRSIVFSEQVEMDILGRVELAHGLWQSVTNIFLVDPPINWGRQAARDYLTSYKGEQIAMGKLNKSALYNYLITTQ